MKTLIESQTYNCKKYKRYSSYTKNIVNHVLGMLEVKKELVVNVDHESNFMRGITIYLPNTELYIRLWDVSENNNIMTTRFSVFEEELPF